MTPDDYTNQEFFIDVGHGHQLYVQDWGKPDARVPIIFLHGGPGGGCSDRHKGRFDPKEQRVIFFDQRGGGKSLPTSSLEHNTTPDLVTDIQKIADHLGLKKFIVSGGSWGSCLALTYAIKHPERLAGLVIHGVFTASQAEIDWLEHGRFQDFFPDAWDRYLAATPKSHHKNPSGYHFQRALGQDAAAAKQSAYAYECLESALLKLDDHFTPPEYSTYEPTGIITEIYYLANRCFMPDNFILNNAHLINVPVWIVQGRYDVVCPPITTHKLHQKLPNSRLVYTINGHKAEHEAHNLLRLAQLQLSGDL